MQQLPRSAEPVLISVLRITDLSFSTFIFALTAHQFNTRPIDVLCGGLFVFFMSLVIYTLKGVYRTWQSYTFLFDITTYVEGHIYLTVSFILFTFLARSLLVLDTSIFIYWAVFSSIAGILTRSILYMVLISNRKRKLFVKKAVVCGISNACVELIEWIRNNPWSSLDIVGVFTRHASAGTIYNIPVVGNPESLTDYVKSHDIDVVYLAFDSYDEKYIQKLVGNLFDTTCSIQFTTDIQAMNFLQYMTVKFLGRLPVISVIESPLSRHKMICKRIEDIVLSLFFITISSPVMIIAAIAIKLTTPGTVIFKQWRYGKNGKPIKVWKFRTMTVSEDGFEFKQATEDDKRITRVGHILRKMSVDELPQFFNVLMGTMSIVGPRPHAINMVDEYRQSVSGAMLRHHIKPGITGLAQLYGTRQAIQDVNQIHERIKYDVEYIRKWTLMLDIKIVLKTIIGLLKRRARVS